MAGEHGEILVYTTENGGVQLDVRLENETVWLTQHMMAELFDTTKQNISYHLKNIFEEHELDQSSTVKDFLTVQNEGAREVQRTVMHYNLDMIIAVGYRVKSKLATHFRIWATQRLREYLIKGFVMNDERLKHPPTEAQNTLPDYFNELQERIRDIRASEKRMYLRVREIFAMSADYMPNDTDTQLFFSKMQNKLHVAATGLTSAEIIQRRADSGQPNMGLTNWKGEVVRKSDVGTAKNYLLATEIDELNRIVTMWLDYAEDQAKRKKQILMQDWAAKLDQFLAFNEREVLQNAGSVSHEQAQLHAKTQYKQYDSDRRNMAEEKGNNDYLESLREAAKIIQGQTL